MGLQRAKQPTCDPAKFNRESSTGENVKRHIETYKGETEKKVMACRLNRQFSRSGTTLISSWRVPQKTTCGSPEGNRDLVGGRDKS